MTTKFEAPPIEEHQQLIKIKNRSSTDYIVVHCSATANTIKYDWKTIDKIHRQKGWLCIGYHYVILTDGTIQVGRGRETVGAHVEGYNDCSLGICLIGGINHKGDPVDNFTKEQKDSLKKLIDWLKSIYVDAKVLGHRDFPDVHKDCPCFDVIPWYKTNGAVYKRLTHDIDKLIVQYNISETKFRDMNGVSPSEVELGDLVRVK